MILFFECAHAERERERREREREKERGRERKREQTELTAAGVNFVFSGFQSTIRGETREPRSAGERSWERAKRTSVLVYRPVSSILTGISPPSMFSQTAERPHKQRRMASRKEQLFALFFVV